MEGSPAWSSLWQLLHTISIKRTGETCIQGAGIVDGSGRKIATFGCIWEHAEDFPQSQLKDWVGFLQHLDYRINNDHCTVISNPSESLHRYGGYNVDNSMSGNGEEASSENEVLTRWLARNDMTDFSSVDTTRAPKNDEIIDEENQTLSLGSAKYCPITSPMDSNKMMAQSLGRAHSQLVLFKRIPHMRSVGGGLFVLALCSKARVIATGGRSKQCSGNIGSVVLEQVDEWLRLNSP